MRKIERDLKREFPFAKIEITGGGHYRLRLPNGRLVIVPSTPGSSFFLRRARADVRQQMNLRNPGETESKGSRP